MADDFGDDAGDKLLDWSIRLIIEHGRNNAYAHSSSFSQALRSAKEQINSAARTVGGNAEALEELVDSQGWAKLDLHEFTSIEGWEELREILGDTLEARGLRHEWFTDATDGKEYLLFRTADARELSDAFDNLANKADEVCEQAAKVVERSRQAELDTRAQQKEAEKESPEAQGPHDPDHLEPDAKDAADDPRRKLTLREKVAAVRVYADELSRTGRDDRTLEAHDLETKRERQRK